MPTVLDVFAGSGGWSWACARLGLHDIGIEGDPWACTTRHAAGFDTIDSDVAAIRPKNYAGITGLIASPPCQPFSAAGRRQGLGDPRGLLVYQPMRVIRP
jgi:DNA (cytosine-5)-methyltransferase 1